MQPSRSQTVQYKDSRVHLRRLGSGERILFFYGLDVGYDSEPFLEELARNHEVIIPDHPGFGASDVPEWIKGIGDMAYFYLDFIKELDLGPLHVVAASLGGWIAAEIAVRDHSNIRSLCLIAPAGVRKKDTAIGDPFILAPGDAARFMFSDIGIADKARRRSETDEEIDIQLKNSVALARIGWQPRLASPELQRWLHRLSVPTRLIWGSVDRVLPPEHGDAWLGAISHAEMSIIEGAGHFPHIEAPREVAAKVTSFIREHVR